jgi:chromosome segregation ATPase
MVISFILRIKDNEIKNERNEIENHKRSLQNYIESLKYDLEKQRQEMKNEFDEILRKREHEWRKSFDEQGTETLAKELQVKLLNNEIELIRENNKRLQTEYDDMESKYKRLERGMKEKDWELKDNISLKDAKIQDLESRVKEFEGNSKRHFQDFKNKLVLKNYFKIIIISNFFAELRKWTKR